MDDEAHVCDPRVARSRASVLAATAELLAEVGFPGVSIEAVSARSGVAKTTIYRHWPTRARLLVAAFRSMACGVPEVDTGDLRGDLVGVLAALAEQLRDAAWSTVLPSLAAEAARDPELAALHREFIAERRGHVTAVIRRGVARGELPADTDEALLTAMLAGPVFYRALVSLEPLDEPGLPERIVDAALHGMRASRVSG